MDVNQIDPDGDTPLDAALRYRRAATVAVLQRLGGLTAQQSAPTLHAAHLARLSTEEDLDLVQANDLGDTGTE